MQIKHTLKEKFRFPVFQTSVKEGFRPVTHIEVDVSYDKGGMCYFNGIKKPRGYYLSAGPITVGENTVSFVIMSHPAVVLEEAKRLDRKKLASIRETVFKDLVAVEGKVWQLIRQVCDKNHLVIVQ